MRVGLIADTHGLLRPEAKRALEGVDAIVHAGDVGSPQVLEELAAIAPVTAVRGNIDRGPWAERLPMTALIDLGPVRIYAVHIIDDLDIEPHRAGIAAVVFGHSHKPVAEQRDSVWFVNPGSAGPRRFSLPVSLAYLDVNAREIEVSIETLDVPPPERRRR